MQELQELQEFHAGVSPAMQEFCRSFAGVSTQIFSFFFC